MQKKVVEVSVSDSPKTSNGELVMSEKSSELKNSEKVSEILENKDEDKLAIKSKVEKDETCATDFKFENKDESSKNPKPVMLKNGTKKKCKTVKLTKIEENEDSKKDSSQNDIKKKETTETLDDSKTTKELKSILKNENIEPNQNGKLSSTSKNIISKAMPPQEIHKENKPVPKKDSEKRVVLPRELTNLSIGNISTASAEGPVQSTSVPQPAERQSVITQSDSWIRSAIPSLPLGLAVVYCILNIIIPGSGTILSGFSILCCGECRVQTKDDQRLITLCVNVCVGVSQLFTITFMLVGWFWSIAWGVDMVILAVELRRRKKQEREIELQKIAVTAFTGDNVRSFFSGKK